jgi:hypothetical protein
MMAGMREPENRHGERVCWSLSADCGQAACGKQPEQLVELIAELAEIQGACDQRCRSRYTMRPRWGGGARKRERGKGPKRAAQPKCAIVGSMARVRKPLPLHYKSRVPPGIQAQLRRGRKQVPQNQSQDESRRSLLCVLGAGSEANRIARRVRSPTTRVWNWERMASYIGCDLRLKRIASPGGSVRPAVVRFRLRFLDRRTCAQTAVNGVPLT